MSSGAGQPGAPPEYSSGEPPLVHGYPRTNEQWAGPNLVSPQHVTYGSTPAPGGGYTHDYNTSYRHFPRPLRDSQEPPNYSQQPQGHLTTHGYLPLHTTLPPHYFSHDDETNRRSRSYASGLPPMPPHYFSSDDEINRTYSSGMPSRSQPRVSQPRAFGYADDEETASQHR
jgi:hypothetical protein